MNNAFKDKMILTISNPILKVWPEEGFLTSIIQNVDTSYDWLMNTFVQTSAYKHEDYDNRIRISYFPAGKHHYAINRFDYCPFVAKYCINSELLDSEKELCSFIVHAISKGYYVSLFVDQFFRFGSAKGNSGKVVHPLFIYGYDNINKIVFTMDNYDNYKFAIKEVTFSDLVEGFSLVEKQQTPLYLHKIYLYKLTEKKYVFDKEYMVNQLKDYLHGCDSTNYAGIYKDNKIYGIRCYDVLFRYLQKIQERGYQSIDMRSFAFIVEHKELMKKRILYFAKNDFINEASREYLYDLAVKMVKEGKIALNLAIKYNNRLEKEIITRLQERIIAVAEYEKLLFQELLNDLD